MASEDGTDKEKQKAVATDRFRLKGLIRSLIRHFLSNSSLDYLQQSMV